MSMTNRNATTGIRFSIYHINNDLHMDVWDDIYRDGTNLTERDALDDLRQRTRDALNELPDELLPYLDLDEVAEEIVETALQNDMNSLWEYDEPVYEGETDGIKWRTTWLGGAPHLWVFESPYFGVGRECSPCVPGALDGGTVESVWRDMVAADTHAYHTVSAPGRCWGYALPSTWLRDATEEENINSGLDLHPQDGPFFEGY